MTVVIGSRTARIGSIRPIGLGDGAFGRRSVRSIVGGGRSLRVGSVVVGGKRAGRNNRVVLTLGGGRTGLRGPVVLWATVGVDWIAIAISGLWGRNGPIGIGAGSRGRRGRDG